MIWEGSCCEEEGLGGWRESACMHGPGSEPRCGEGDWKTKCLGLAFVNSSTTRDYWSLKLHLVSADKRQQ